MQRYLFQSITLILVLLAAANPFCVGQVPSANNQRQSAITLEQEGKNAEAAAAWREVIKTQPASAEAYAHLGFLESRQQHYKEAIPSYRKALALDPSMPGLQMNLGLALFKTGGLRDALRIFTSLRKKQSAGSGEALRLDTLIGLSYYGLEDYSTAVPYLKEATSADPQNLPFRLFLAHSCLWSKQYQCVLDVYHEILLLNAESAEADMLAGEALDATNDHAGAIQQFRAAIKANPQEPNAHFGLGYLLWTQNQYEEAALEFQAELSNVPTHVQALVYLADTNIKLNQPEAALPLIKKAIQLNPRVELAHLDLGIVYMNSGRKAEAIRELKTAITLAPADVNPHYRLARLYQSMGRKSEADAEFQKTKSLTKAADESVFNKLREERTKNKPDGAASGVVSEP